MTYHVHYEDGENVEVPVGLQRDIHFLTRTENVLDMENATIAWQAPYDDETPGEQSVLYSMQWTNPRPKVAIDHIDVTLDPRGDDWWGNPLILGITAATELQ
jgi:hypothetical protein